MRAELPSGTVTFLFTDVEGSTRLLHELGAQAYAEALAEHRRAIREACAGNSGVEVDTQGDAFFFAFATAPDALAAASDFTERLGANGPVRVRVGSTPERRFSEKRATSGKTSTVPHASPPQDTAVRCSSRPRQRVSCEAELTDLGEHRFKDLGAPERVFQLGDGEFPTLESLYRTNLPIPATPFLGRQRELEDVIALVSRPDARLVTLVGPGGAGKTRLGLQAAAEVSDDFRDGVFWVPLAPLRDEAAVPTAFAQALAVEERPGVSMLDSIVSTVADRRLLLVVDNCEHLVDAVAPLVRTLLDGCPSLVAVASSRERLGLRAERLYDVPPMVTSDAEALFRDRATAASADFRSDEHVAAICDAVDGLPLAIELAAARVRSLSTETIRSRLDERLVLLTARTRDVEERQRTLEATIAWSYDLLSEEEQRVLRSLSVFAGGCTLAGAEAVAGADLDVLESLLDKSLLRHRVDEAGQDRYWLLETIREYAARELALAAELEEAQVRHTSFYLTVAAGLSPHVARPVSDEQVRGVRSDRENFRTAHARALAAEDGAIAVRLVRCLARILFRIEPTESHAVVRASLALPGAALDDRAYALVRLASFESVWGDHDWAKSMLSEAEALFERLGDRLGLVDATAWQSAIAAMQGEYDGAIALAEKLARLAAELDDPDVARYADQALGDALGSLAVENDDRVAAERSRPLQEARVRAAARYESGIEEFSAMGRLALTLFVLGDYSESIALCQRAARRALDIGLVEYAAPAVPQIGLAAAARGDHRLGVTLVAFGLARVRETGELLARDAVALFDRFERSSRDALGDAEYEDAVRAGEALSIEEAIELALGVSVA